MSRGYEAMFWAPLVAAVILAAAPVAAQDQSSDVFRVEDVVVEGRRLDEAAGAYVATVALPARRRGPARWDDGICVGAVNFQREVAQHLVDRVSDVARELGIQAQEPPCRPNIIIFGADDGPAFAQALVAERPRIFTPSASGTTAGTAALNAFRTDVRPVRWWHVSTPIDSQTGRRATRVSGDMALGGLSDDSPLGYAPLIFGTGASRLQTQVEDRLERSFIIIDVDMLEGANLAQLSDYVAFVSLAQVNPDAELARFESILNLFEPGGEDVAGLSEWDRAYLAGLYAVRFGYVSLGAQRSALGRALLSAYEARPAQD